MRYTAGDRVRVTKNPYDDGIDVGATGVVVWDNGAPGGSDSVFVRLDGQTPDGADNAASNLLAVLYQRPEIRGTFPFERAELEKVA